VRPVGQLAFLLGRRTSTVWQELTLGLLTECTGESIFSSFESPSIYPCRFQFTFPTILGRLTQCTYSVMAQPSTRPPNFVSPQLLLSCKCRYPSRLVSSALPRIHNIVLLSALNNCVQSLRGGICRRVFRAIHDKCHVSAKPPLTPSPIQVKPKIVEWARSALGRSIYIILPISSAGLLSLWHR
jgi:hypothetical protein